MPIRFMQRQTPNMPVTFFMQRLTPTLARLKQLPTVVTTAPFLQN